MFAGLGMERWHIGPRIYMQDSAVCQTVSYSSGKMTKKEEDTKVLLAETECNFESLQ